ncbi:MAG TPA: hypothetical protein DD636_04845 [Anaerolineaceae bacterium]|jgi:hypothetical protein|nr:hypothetical protein [Anaerolineaceae bacterium]
MIDRKDNHIDADINQGLEDIYLVSPRPDFLPGLGSILTLKAKEKIGEDNKKNFFPRTSRKPLFALVSFVLVVILFTLFTSPGQTFAQQILHFFYPTNDQTHPVATASLSNDESTRLAIQAAKLAESCPQNELEERYLCEVSFAESNIGFSVFAIQPEEFGLFFSSMDFDVDRKIVNLYYGYHGYEGTDRSIWIAQGIGEFPTRISAIGEDDWGRVPTQSIETVAVNGQTAEFVVGQWALASGETQYTWSTQIPGMTLRWHDGDHWFQLSKGGQPEMVTNMNKEDLIRIAESIHPSFED